MGKRTDKPITKAGIFSSQRLAEICNALKKYLGSFSRGTKVKQIEKELGVPYKTVMSWTYYKTSKRFPDPDKLYLLWLASEDNAFWLTAAEQRAFNARGYHVPSEFSKGQEIEEISPEEEDGFTEEGTENEVAIDRQEVLSKIRAGEINYGHYTQIYGEDRLKEISEAIRVWRNSIISQRSKMKEFLGVSDRTVFGWTEPHKSNHAPDPRRMKKLYEFTGNEVFLLTPEEQFYFGKYKMFSTMSLDFSKQEVETGRESKSFDDQKMVGSLEPAIDQEFDQEIKTDVVENVFERFFQTEIKIADKFVVINHLLLSISGIMSVVEKIAKVSPMQELPELTAEKAVSLVSRLMKVFGFNILKFIEQLPGQHEIDPELVKKLDEVFGFKQ